MFDAARRLLSPILKESVYYEFISLGEFYFDPDKEVLTTGLT